MGLKDLRKNRLRKSCLKNPLPPPWRRCNRKRCFRPSGPTATEDHGKLHTSRNRADLTVLAPLQGVFRRRSTHADLVSQGRVRDVFARNVARLHTVRCDFQVPGVSEYLYNRRFPVAQILRNTLRPIVAPPSSALASDVLHRIFG